MGHLITQNGLHFAPFSPYFYSSCETDHSAIIIWPHKITANCKTQNITRLFFTAKKGYPGLKQKYTKKWQKILNLT
jgi:hypothetical protein